MKEGLMSTTNPFLNIAYPTKVLTALEDGRVGPFALRQIENDYRPGYLTNNPRIREDIPARAYLAQVEVGAAALNYAARQLDEQQQSKDVLRLVYGQSVLAHQSVQGELARLHVALDGGLQRAVSTIMEEGSLLREDLHNEFSSLADVQREAAEHIGTTIIEATDLLRRDLHALHVVAEKQEHLLTDILSTLRSPKETQVTEYVRAATKLIALGYTQRGIRKYDTWKDAILHLEAASADPVGRTNPVVAMHLGVMLWKTHAKLGDKKLARKGLTAAKDAFERASRLFEAESSDLSIRALRHYAHMQYLLSDSVGAYKSLSSVSEQHRTYDVLFDLARYAASLERVDDMLHFLKQCVKIRPITSVSMFAEPDFRPYFGKLLQLLESMTRDVQQKIERSVMLVHKEILSHTCDGLREKQLGVVRAHQELKDIAHASTQALGYVDCVRLEKRANAALRAMDSSTTIHDLLDILEFYKHDEVLLQLIRSLLKSPDELEYMEQRDSLLPYLEKLDEEREGVVQSEIKKYSTLFENVANILRGLHCPQGQVSVVMSAPLGRVWNKSKNVRVLSVHEVREDASMARAFLDALSQEWCRTQGDLLYGLTVEFRQKYFRLEVPTRLEDAARAEYFLHAMMCVPRWIPGKVPQAHAELCDILLGIKEKTLRLSVEKRHGFGAYWNISVPKYASLKDGEYKVNISDREEKGMFGRSKRVPFCLGDPVTLSLLYPSLQYIFEKHPSILRALRSARLEQVCV